MGLKESFFGDGETYSYASLCALSNPFSSKKPQPVTFYGRGKLSSVCGTKIYLNLPILY